MLLYLFLSLTPASFASDNTEFPVVETKDTIWLGSNSICLDGIVAIMGGMGCKNIRVLDIDSERTTIECLDEDTPDDRITGVFTVAPIDYLNHTQGRSTPPTDLMCMDSNVALFRNR
jgi:hypothetical protein